MKKTEIAKQLGKLAQQNGMDRLCRLDGTLQDMLSFDTPKTNVSLMKAWYAGYDAALVQADVTATADRTRKLDLIWKGIGKDYRGIRDGKRSITRWAKYGGGIVKLDDLPDAEVEEMASYYAKGK